MKNKDGTRYVGYFKNGLFNGEGAFEDTAKNYIYKGNWEKNFQNGYGEQIWTLYKQDTKFKNDRICHFRGEFKNGEMHGEGKLEYDDKSFYEGHFIMNKMEGNNSKFYFGIEKKLFFGQFKDNQI
jgi:hypothetical protein